MFDSNKHLEFVRQNHRGHMSRFCVARIGEGRGGVSLSAVNAVLICTGCVATRIRRSTSDFQQNLDRVLPTHP